MPLQGKRRSNMRRAAARTLGASATMMLSAGSSCRSCCCYATAIPSAATRSAFIQLHSNGLGQGAVHPRAMLGTTPASTTRPPPIVGSTSMLLGGTGGNKGSSKGQRRLGDRSASEGGVSLQATSILLNGEPTDFGGRQPLISRAARCLIARFIMARARACSGLSVLVEARSNRAAMRGRLDTVTIQCDELILDNIQVTAGAKLEILGVDFLTLGLLPGPMRRLRRLRRPCEVSGTAEFTDSDLMYSPAVRRLAERVVNAALRPRARSTLPFKLSTPSSENDADALAAAAAGGVAQAYSGGDGAEEVGGDGEAKQLQVHVFRVRVRGRKLAVEGEMANGPFSRLPFRYDISLSVSRNGQILYLKDPSVYWGTPGGHVPLPMLPQLQVIKVDMGDRAKIEHLHISRGRMRIGGRFIMSPVVPFTVSPGSKQANVEHDLAETLTRLVHNTLRFNRQY